MRTPRPLLKFKFSVHSLIVEVEKPSGTLTSWGQFYFQVDIKLSNTRHWQGDVSCQGWFGEFDINRTWRTQVLGSTPWGRPKKGWMSQRIFTLESTISTQLIVTTSQATSGWYLSVVFVFYHSKLSSHIAFQRALLSLFSMTYCSLFTCLLENTAPYKKLFCPT